MSSRYISKKKKDLVRKRANFCCEYFQSLEGFSLQTFSMEHVIPVILGGNDPLAKLSIIVSNL